MKVNWWAENSVCNTEVEASDILMVEPMVNELAAIAVVMTVFRMDCDWEFLKVVWMEMLKVG
jgi:hypothetical protein